MAAHSDDEVLGCGGTIAKHVANGDRVSVVFMTDGVGSRVDNNKKDAVVRNTSSQRALSTLSISNSYQFDFPDNNMDSVPLLEVVQKLEQVIDKVQPSVVYTHYAHDLNVDHRITHQAVMTACRPQAQSSVKEIYTFEVLSSTEWASKANCQFLPLLIVDISDCWELKLKALKCYHGEMRKFPHSRSYEAVEALALLRGSTHGVGKAEAFFVERIIK
ncbi:PIG-L family deacetylase [Vibrio profundum]|uniref:PIG-L deacetylase family protein n=1 Tax=Vibrio profundum TaxID=2910247 RepID=UPI003D0BDB75